jgi:trehalose 6-phosphate synthase
VTQNEPSRSSSRASRLARAIDDAARAESKIAEALAELGNRARDEFDRLFEPFRAWRGAVHGAPIRVGALAAAQATPAFREPQRAPASTPNSANPNQGTSGAPVANPDPKDITPGERAEPRLVIVSNRVAAPEAGRAPTAGGLAVAVKAALKTREGLWFGWSGKIDDANPGEPRTLKVNKTSYTLIDLSDHDFQEYYNGLANRVLWPILHYRVDLQEYSRADASGYMRVNRLFADKLSPLIREDDVIWVHDYHLMPLGRELRARGHRNSIGFFLHIPCAPPDILQALPDHQEILGSMADYDLVGFQTDNDRDNFAHYLTSQGAKAIRGDAYQIDGRTVRLGVFPVGIETSAYARLARNVGRSPLAAQIRESLSDCRLVLGVDRLDYSKGIPQRVKAFGRFLEANPEWHSKVTLLQITPKSRGDIKEYAEIEGEVTTLVGGINGRFGDAAWTPIRYVNRSYSRTALAGIYRIADVAMATPLRDGMNLVAKEFLAAQDPDDPGVLLLSQFAGAAASLDRALLVNPHESEGVAAALKRALEMPREERRERHAPMLEYLVENDIRRWADDFLSTLAESPRPVGLFDGLLALFAGPAEH